ncbi:MAG: dienelactone hydrolase family protein [Myxococcota bacterium]
MDWSGDAVISKGVTERAFELACDGRRVPGIVWTPEEAQNPTATVLIGHGGGGNKREPHILALARRLVRHHGIAAAAIDGPVHGDRAPTGAELSVGERRAAMREGTVVEDTIADWKATLDAIQELPEIGIGRVGYWGLSMGTMFGLPFVASEPRVEAAVLGLMGTGVFAGDRLSAYAAKVRCPVLFLQQLDDELIPKEASSALFDLLATDEKQLHANAGAHAAAPPEEFDKTEAFLAHHLR